MNLKFVVCVFAFMVSTSVFAQNLASIGKAPIKPTPETVVFSKMTREATISLHNEIVANADNPLYNRESALQRLYASPFVNRGLNVQDETFPIQILSGDKIADAKAYSAMKKQWIAENPERYSAIKAKTK